MPNGIPQTGSFSSNDPNAQAAVKAAIQARSQGSQPVPQLSQTGQQPSAQVPQPTPSVSAPSQIGPTPQVKPPATESELIIKGLTQRLSAISKVETASVETPQQPGPRIAPTS